MIYYLPRPYHQPSSQHLSSIKSQQTKPKPSLLTSLLGHLATEALLAVMAKRQTLFPQEVEHRYLLLRSAFPLNPLFQFLHLLSRISHQRRGGTSLVELQRSRSREKYLQEGERGQAFSLLSCGLTTSIPSINFFISQFFNNSKTGQPESIFESSLAIINAPRLPFKADFNPGKRPTFSNYRPPF